VIGFSYNGITSPQIVVFILDTLPTHIHQSGEPSPLEQLFVMTFHLMEEDYQVRLLSFPKLLFVAHTCPPHVFHHLFFVEQFWNCAEITVTPRSGTGDSDVSTPRPSSNVARPTFFPSPSPIAVTSSPSSFSESMCGNGSIGNGKCPDNSMCCSHFGWCGTGELYCKPTYDKATKSPSTTEQSTNAPSQAPKNEPISPVTSESLTIPFPDYANGDCSNGNEKSRMKINVGYYQSWAIYRESGCNPVWPDDIDIEKHGYTHLIYAFASINSTYQLEPWDGNYKDEVPLYEALNALKSKYPKLKTMIAVGGWTFNDPGDTETRFSDTARTSARRKVFAASCVEFCRRYNFDGVDLDWEYPGDVNRGGSSVDKRNYGSLLEAIRTAFDESSMELELSMASAIASYRLDAGYDLSTLARYLDFFNLMTYDIHGTWDVPKVVDAHTDMKYIFKSVQYFLDVGVPSTKLVLGLAAYGRTYKLADESCTLAGCPFSSAGEGGCAGEKGFMPYFTIDEYVQGKNLKSLTFNAETGSMELVLKDNVWISYDTPQTLQLKYDFANQSCFRGIMWWAVDMLTSRQEALVILDTLPQDTTTPAFPAPSKLDVDWTKWTVSSDSRCGISELDARGHCRKTCISDDDCNTVEGHTCFRVHDNYCNSKPDCTLPDDLDVKSYPLALRCGQSEIVARELCGKPCQSYDDCDGENGEYCFVVNPNFCDASCI
jgi:chitinase